MTVCCPQTCRPIGTEGWWCWLLLTSPPTHQKNVHKLIMPFLNNYYKTSHSLPQVGAHGFEGISPLGPPLPGKVIKIFFLILKSYTSEIWLTMMYREAKLLASIDLSSHADTEALGAARSWSSMLYQLRDLSQVSKLSQNFFFFTCNMGMAIVLDISTDGCENLLTCKKTVYKTWRNKNFSYF